MACKSPSNLKANEIDCSILRLNWMGNKNQPYLVSASYTDAALDEMIKIEIAKFSSDNYGNCVTSVPVKEGINVSWGIQAVCSTCGFIYYSSKVNGPDADIPYCEKRNNVVRENNVQVYPNPAANYFMVEFNGNTTGNIEFKVFAITGKKVYDKYGDAVTKSNNQYKLNLHNPPSGTYMLELHSNNQIHQVKFVLVRP